MESHLSVQHLEILFSEGLTNMLCAFDSIFTCGVGSAEKLGVLPSECVVIEDSMVGLGAARAAGMRCIITYTPNTRNAPFPGAERIVSELGDDPAEITVADIMRGGIVQDDRIEFNVTGSAVTFK